VEGSSSYLNSLFRYERQTDPVCVGLPKILDALAHQIGIYPMI
jgi:hypothetical protein